MMSRWVVKALNRNQMCANVVQCIRSGERGADDCQNRRLVNREGVNQRSTCKGSVKQKQLVGIWKETKPNPFDLKSTLHLIGLLLEPV